MSISLTPAAADRVQSFLTRRGRGLGLRLAVKKTGCSGFAYVVNYADEIGSNDLVFEDQGVKVIVDRESLGFIDGTEIDLSEGWDDLHTRVYERTLAGHGFGITDARASIELVHRIRKVGRGRGRG